MANEQTVEASLRFVPSGSAYGRRRADDSITGKLVAVFDL